MIAFLLVYILPCFLMFLLSTDLLVKNSTYNPEFSKSCLKCSWTAFLSEYNVLDQNKNLSKASWTKGVLEFKALCLILFSSCTSTSASFFFLSEQFFSGSRVPWQRVDGYQWFPTLHAIFWTRGVTVIFVSYLSSKSPEEALIGIAWSGA